MLLVRLESETWPSNVASQGDGRPTDVLHGAPRIYLAPSRRKVEPLLSSVLCCFRRSTDDGKSLLSLCARRCEPGRFQRPAFACSHPTSRKIRRHQPANQKTNRCHKANERQRRVYPGDSYMRPHTKINLLLEIYIRAPQQRIAKKK